GYEALVEKLTAEGLVDPAKVGLSGFSRTSFHVKYAISHAGSRFAAAATADGFDMGYMTYVTALNVDNGSVQRDVERANGGSPYDRGIFSWLKKSPVMRAARIETPLLMQAIRPASLGYEWDMYAALTSLGRPA